MVKKDESKRELNLNVVVIILLQVSEVTHR